MCVFVMGCPRPRLCSSMLVLLAAPYTTAGLGSFHKYADPNVDPNII